MKATPKTAALLASMLEQVLGQVPTTDGEEIITDFHVQTDADTGEVSVTDDDDNVLAQAFLEDYEEADESEFRQCVGSALRPVLSRMQSEKRFEGIGVFRPFSFVLEDGEKETLEELLVVDDEQVMLDDELLKGLDDELDEFLKNLLEN